MTENDKNKDGGSIKDRILSGGDASSSKKKIVIKKKQAAPQNKDITDLFKKETRKESPPGERKESGAAASGKGPAQPRPEAPRRPPEAHGEARRSSPPAGAGPHRGGREGGPGPDQQQLRGGRPAQPRHPVVRKASPPIQKGPEGGRGHGHVHEGGRSHEDVRRSRDTTSMPGGPSFTGAGTPFDAVIESARKPVSAAGPGRRSTTKKGAPEEAAAGAGAGRKGERGPVKDSSRSGVRGGGGSGGRTGRGRDENYSRFLNRIERRKQPTQSGTTVPKSIEIMESIQVGELAKKLNLKPGDVISRLMKMGEMVTITKTVDADIATLLASEFGCEVKVVSLYDETVIEEQEDLVESQVQRPPVVTIMGHVDHGKTKLLDTIRKTNVIDTEAGAITQHIGAYQVQTSGGKITFLDTPGHEAFTAMRARGAAVTDIVVLVVAADDGVKEQTVEAIRHAQEAGVPIIVAINKIDLPTANPDRVKQELTQFGLQSEDWGGSNIFCEISARENIGIQNLLDMILLQAEVLDLKANENIKAIGHVIEAKIDPGKGPVATILVQKGTLHEGDPYVVGVFSGRIRAMFDDLGRRVKEAGPSAPVEITGIDGVPEAGDPFQVVEHEKYGREVAAKRQHYKQITSAAQRVQPTIGDLRTWVQDHKELKVIIKADVQGSVEAIKDGLVKLSTEDVKVRVIHGATGAISESDVTLASASNALIVGFQVRATPRALELADRSRVDIKYYSIIYKVIEDIKASMEGLLEPEKVEEITGHAEVRQIFRISRVGTIAGCMITSGKIHRKNRVRVLRENVVVHTGDIKAIRRVKDEVSEINEGFECGISLEGFNDLKEGDILEAFTIKEVARKL